MTALALDKSDVLRDPLIGVFEKPANWRLHRRAEQWWQFLHIMQHSDQNRRQDTSPAPFR